MRKGGGRMSDYKNIISHIDIDRSLGSISYFILNESSQDDVQEFLMDIGEGNDSIELHLVKSMAYKEALVLKLKKESQAYSDAWKGLLHEEQKTFGGSKIFYINHDCTKLLVLSMPNEMKNKINMLVTRLNKINEKISRINSRIKKENAGLYSMRIKDRQNQDKTKEDLINFINQNLRV